MSTADVAMVDGGTRWRRFALAFGGSFAIIAAVMALMATGVLAAPVTISGTVFTVKADSLVSHKPASGPGFIQYGFVDADGSHNPTGVAVTYLPGGGLLDNMNQTVCGPTGLPGPFAYLIVSLSADSADAHGGLVVDATQLHGDTALFHNIQIGVPASGVPDQSADGSFSQTADSVAINGINQQAVYTQAGTFALKNLGLSAHLASSCPS